MAGNIVVNVFADILYNMYTKFVAVFPGLVFAVVILIVGYLLGTLVGWLINKVLFRTKVCEVSLEKTGLSRFTGKCYLVNFIGVIVKWYIFVLFLPVAAQFIYMERLANFLDKLALWVPHLIAGVVIALLGLLAAEYAADHIKAIKAKGTVIIADSVRVIIWVFTFIFALDQIGVDVGIAENVFSIILGGIMLALALALGIGYGLGLRDEAKKHVGKLYKKF